MDSSFTEISDFDKRQKSKWGRNAPEVKLSLSAWINCWWTASNNSTNCDHIHNFDVFSFQKSLFNTSVWTFQLYNSGFCYAHDILGCYLLFENSAK